MIRTCSWSWEGIPIETDMKKTSRDIYRKRQVKDLWFPVLFKTLEIIIPILPRKILRKLKRILLRFIRELRSQGKASPQTEDGHRVTTHWGQKVAGAFRGEWLIAETQLQSAWQIKTLGGPIWGGGAAGCWEFYLQEPQQFRRVKIWKSGENPLLLPDVGRKSNFSETYPEHSAPFHRACPQGNYLTAS